MEKEVIGKFIVGQVWQQTGSVSGISAKCLRVKCTVQWQLQLTGVTETKRTVHDSLFFPQNVVEAAVFLQHKAVCGGAVGQVVFLFLFLLTHFGFCVCESASIQFQAIF